jgi:predicted pyridoxine 5'-phosphate oxidase superfamily flavin-nucleotide-binding protein
VDGKEPTTVIVVAVEQAFQPGSSQGLDCSPKGDKPGFVEVEDDGRTLLIPDRRGNNRLDSVRAGNKEDQCNAWVLDQVFDGSKRDATHKYAGCRADDS